MELTKDLLRGTVVDELFDKADFIPRKVKVRIIRREGGWLPPDHEASVLMQDSKIIFCAPTSSSRRQIIDPLDGLSMKQKGFLAKKIGRGEDGDIFNVHREKDNYWHKFEIILNRDGALYDLSKPLDFLKWATLRADTDKIAPSWDQKFMRGTYKFALVEEGEEDNQKLDKAGKMKEAYRLYGRLEVSEEKMRDFLWIYSMSYKDAQKPSKQATPKFLQTQIADVVENYTDRFLELANDPDYDTKLLIRRGVLAGAIALRKNKYFLGDETEPTGDLAKMIEYLDDDAFQQDRLKVMGLIEKNNKEE